jgi:hypothetical protein
MHLAVERHLPDETDPPSRSGQEFGGDHILGRFGLTVVTTGDCASATYAAYSADDLARLYAQFRKTFTPPEPVVAEPVVATVATESAFEAAPDPELGAWSDER